MGGEYHSVGPGDEHVSDKGTDKAIRRRVHLGEQH